MKKWALLLLFLIPSLITGALTKRHLDTLYNSLDPHSISELFALYYLYPKTEQGERALAAAWSLMNLHRREKIPLSEGLALPPTDLQAIITLANKQHSEQEFALTDEQLSTIERVSDHLHNRKLRGFSVGNRRDIPSLPSEEIDLARALLLYQFEGTEDSVFKIRQYEASLDLMTLQILARLPLHATREEKIHMINQFIFHEKRFRFPPHSIWAKDIDLYTFLPSVLDSRLGVCLGISILYLSIAQRLDLPLEIITPPGHIYLRYVSPEITINIETTARGISPPSHTYLGINTRHLQKRSLKEVIGLAFINKAAVTWQNEDYQTTAQLYEKALPYLPNDPLLKMLLGYNYLFIDETEKGKALLEEIREMTFDYAVYRETTPEDYSLRRTNAEAIKTIFLHVDETRVSILEKKKKIREVLKQFPKFRDAILQLAITQLQLSETGEALETLCRYHELDPHNPTVEYYLSVISLERLRFQKAWQHLKNTERITQARNHYPRALKQLRHHLRTLYPDPEA